MTQRQARRGNDVQPSCSKQTDKVEETALSDVQQARKKVIDAELFQASAEAPPKVIIICYPKILGR